MAAAVAAAGERLTAAVEAGCCCRRAGGGGGGMRPCDEEAADERDRAAVDSERERVGVWWAELGADEFGVGMVDMDGRCSPPRA